MEHDGFPKEDADNDELKEKFKNVKLKELEETLDMDPSIFYAFTLDMMRIDIGLMI